MPKNSVTTPGHYDKPHNDKPHYDKAHAGLLDCVYCFVWCPNDTGVMVSAI